MIPLWTARIQLSKNKAPRVLCTEWGSLKCKCPGEWKGNTPLSLQANITLLPQLPLLLSRFVLGLVIAVGITSRSIIFVIKLLSFSSFWQELAGQPHTRFSKRIFIWLCKLFADFPSLWTYTVKKEINLHVPEITLDSNSSHGTKLQPSRLIPLHLTWLFDISSPSFLVTSEHDKQ